MAEGYDGVERRRSEAGRRSGDTCSQHCILVKQWEDQKLQHKEDTKEMTDRLKASAPLWSVIILCGLIVSSVVYTFKTSNEIQVTFSDRMTEQTSEVKNAVSKLSTEMAIFSLKQQQVIRILERHIDTFGPVPGPGIGAGERINNGNRNK